MNQATSSFELLRTQPIESLNLTVEEYRHVPSGAPHIHLKSDNPENVFLVALRTVPMDSTGVAHILEHTALCGSRHYPVRDPFFSMIRRSLNTFMNAFTSSDWTAYPFASQNRKDFFNLLDVYLDAVFFPQLHPLDFAQEGHRLGFVDDNPQNPLEIRGVVYNEMKGAMSSAVATLWQRLSYHLFPTTTYHYNSGGEPVDIPKLTHEQLTAFHRRHYHPSNAIFMTFGDIDAGEHQQRFETVLSEYSDRVEPIEVGLEQRYSEPQVAREGYDLAEGEETSNATHHVLGWLLGSSIDLMSSMEAQLLAAVLLDNSSSPLQLALESSKLGRAPSPLCGVDLSQREICFACGLEGSEPGQAEAVEQLVLDTLQQVANQGVALEEVEACLHQLELQQREISGDSYPYGLQLIMSALGSTTHGGDPVALLDLDPVLKELRKRIQNQDYIPSLCRKLLLDNPHRVRLTLEPEPGLNARQEEELAQELARQKAAFKQKDIDALLKLTQDLNERQAQEDDPSMLPKVGLEDVPVRGSWQERQLETGRGAQVSRYQVGTNGLVYQMLVSELPALSDRELELLPLLTHLVTDLGIGDDDYLSVQRRQAAVCGSISVNYTLRGAPDDAQRVKGYLITSGKALYRNQKALTDLMLDTQLRTRLDELERIRELVAHTRARADASLTGQGHVLAMQAAASRFSPVNYLSERTGGLSGIQSLRDLDRSLENNQALQKLAGELAELQHKLAQQPGEWVLISEAEQSQQFTEQLQNCHLNSPDGSSRLELPPMQPQPANCFWSANSQVNFCAAAYPTVTTDHPDAAALSALGGLLRNLYLHPLIREKGGAYGGGASQDNNNGAFRFFSYRDPRFGGTLDDFDYSIQQFLEQPVEDRFLEEAQLGVLSSLDKPGSPAGECRSTYTGLLFGRDQAVRDRFRQRVMQLNMDQLRSVAEKYLAPENRSLAVLGSNTAEAEAAELGLTIHKLK